MATLEYKLIKTQDSMESIATVLKDDINGSRLIVSSRGIALDLKILDLVNYINQLEDAKKKQEESQQPEMGIDFDKGPVA